MPGLTTNPNLGIGLGYDSRTDLGYGKTDSGSGVGGGLGSPWAVTGNAGIYKEKSYYEKELDKDKLEDEDDDECEIEEFEVDISMRTKSHSAHNQAVSDFGAKYGTDPYSYNGLANTSQYLGAGYNRGENVLKEFIREALQEELLKEITSMSVRVMVKGTVGDAYKSSTANVSNVNQMNPGDPSIKQHGYGQKAKTPAIYPYSDEGLPTTDGGELTNKLDDDIEAEFPWEQDEYTTGDYLYDTSTREYFDQKNVQNHIKKTKIKLNR
jgi:hypothetical protein